MSWKSHIEELRARERLAEQMGGEERVARQRSQGKLTVRERIAFLADPGSFHEVGKIAGKAGYGPDEQIAEFLPATMVFGRATLDGRPAVILGDDFTVRGGASDASIAGKMLMAEQMAHEYGMPIVRMVDGTGGGGSVKSLEQNPRTYIPTTPAWEWLVANMSRVPVVALALGPCAGLGAGRVAASHFSVMVKGLSARSLSPGRRWRRRSARMSTRKALAAGRSRGATASSTMSSRAKSEAFATARRFLSYLPSSTDELPPIERVERRSEAEGTVPASTSCRRTARRRTSRGGSSRRCATSARKEAASSRSANCGDGRSSPALRASTDIRWRCWRAIRSFSMAPGRRMRATRW